MSSERGQLRDQIRDINRYLLRGVGLNEKGRIARVFPVTDLSPFEDWQDEALGGLIKRYSPLIPLPTIGLEYCSLRTVGGVIVPGHDKLNVTFRSEVGLGKRISISGILRVFERRDTLELRGNLRTLMDGQILSKEITREDWPKGSESTDADVKFFYDLLMNLPS